MVKPFLLISAHHTIYAGQLIKSVQSTQFFVSFVSNESIVNEVTGVPHHG